MLTSLLNDAIVEVKGTTLSNLNPQLSAISKEVEDAIRRIVFPFALLQSEFSDCLESNTTVNIILSVIIINL